MDLGNAQDRDKTVERESASIGSPDYIKFNEDHNFLMFHYVLKGKGAAAKAKFPYNEQMVHWIPTGEKSGTAVVCLGGLERGGFAPDVCPVCTRVLKHFQDKKSYAADSDTVMAETENKAGNNLRAGQRIVMNAIRVIGERFKDPKTKKFFVEIELPENARLQKANLSKAQFDQLKKMIEEEMKGDINKLKHVVLDFYRDPAEKNKSKRARIIIEAVSNEKKFPTVTNEPFDLDTEFSVLEESEIEKLLTEYDAFLSGDEGDFEKSTD